MGQTAGTVGGARLGCQIQPAIPWDKISVYPLFANVQLDFTQEPPGQIPYYAVFEFLDASSKVTSRTLIPFWFVFERPRITSPGTSVCSQFAELFSALFLSSMGRVATQLDVSEMYDYTKYFLKAAGAGAKAIKAAVTKPNPPPAAQATPVAPASQTIGQLTAMDVKQAEEELARRVQLRNRILDFNLYEKTAPPYATVTLRVEPDEIDKLLAGVIDINKKRDSPAAQRFEAFARSRLNAASFANAVQGRSAEWTNAKFRIRYMALEQIRTYSDYDETKAQAGDEFPAKALIGRRLLEPVLQQFQLQGTPIATLPARNLLARSWQTTRGVIGGRLPTGKVAAGLTAAAVGGVALWAAQRKYRQLRESLENIQRALQSNDVETAKQLAMASARTETKSDVFATESESEGGEEGEAGAEPQTAEAPPPQGFGGSGGFGGFGGVPGGEGASGGSGVEQEGGFGGESEMQGQTPSTGSAGSAGSTGSAESGGSFGMETPSMSEEEEAEEEE